MAVRHCSCGSHAESLPCQRALPEEVSLTHYADRRFLADFGYDGKPDLAFLDIEDRIRRIPLREDSLFPGNGQALPARSNRREEGAGVEPAVVLGCCNRSHRQPF